MPGPTPSAGFPHEYADLTIPVPPVASIKLTAGWFIRALVASIEGSSIHKIQFSGAPALIAASLKYVAACTLHFWADGWNPNTITFLVFAAIIDLNIVVEVGFVTGVTPAIIPTGSAISSYPSSSFLLITPTVLSYLILW